MKIGKREVVISFIVLIVLVLTIFFPNLRMSQEQYCGECTEWETIGCGLEEYGCSELELTQIRNCAFPDIQNLPIGDGPLFSAPKEMGLDITPKEKQKEPEITPKPVEEEIQEVEEESSEEIFEEEIQEQSTSSTSSSNGVSDKRKTPPIGCLSRCIQKATACNTPPEQPSNPTPSNSQINVLISSGLSWTGSDINSGQELEYDIYFGAESLELISTQSGSNYSFGELLNYSTTYNWQIIVSDGYDTTVGQTWHFTTEPKPNAPPEQPINPNPEDGAQEIDLLPTLTWTCSDDGELSYDIYLGINDSGLNTISKNQIEPSYQIIQELDYSTTYYWKIRAIDEHSAATESDIIKFTTREEPIIVETRGAAPYALFDIKVNLFNESKISYPGEDIWADIIMYNMGTLKPVDVIIDCTLEDMNGTMYDYFQETLAVEEQTAMNRSMAIPLAAKLDYYVYQCVLSYHDEVAVSSDLFETKERIIPIEDPKEDYSKLYKTILALFIVILILLFLLIRKRPKKKRKAKKKIKQPKKKKRKRKKSRK